MFTLNPGETFVINRILKDHTDATTYYVRAVVYDATTRAALNTLSLTDNGNRWFSVSYKVPWDNTFSRGRRILIITSVYTDSGYTTKSNNHGDESEEYLVQQRWDPAFQGVGGGSSIDEATLKRIFSEVIANIPIEEPPPKEDISPYFGDIKAHVDARFNSIEKPNFIEMLTEMSNDIKRYVFTCIQEMEMPRPTDVSKLEKMIQTQGAVISRLFKALEDLNQTKENEQMLSEIRSLAETIMVQHTEFINEAKDSFKNAQMTLVSKNAYSLEAPDRERQSYLKKIKAKYT